MSLVNTPAIRPNRIIWEHGNYFVDAAVLCNKNRLVAPMAVNAALAIELYLKSFLAINIVDTKGGYVDFSSERGHQFISLFNRIDERYKSLLVQKMTELNDEEEFTRELQRYEGAFIEVRYWYDSNSNHVIDPKIVDLAIKLGEAVKAIGLEVSQRQPTVDTAPA